MDFYNIIDEFAGKYGGRLYCEELFDTIRAVTNNNIFLEQRGVYGTFAERLVESFVTPEVFYVIRDTVRRNSRSEQETNEILDELFAKINVANVILVYGIRIASILAEVIPSFGEMLTRAIEKRDVEIRLMYSNTRGGKLEEVIGITNRLPEIDFIVQHSTLHEDFLTRNLSIINRTMAEEYS